MNKADGRECSQRRRYVCERVYVHCVRLRMGQFCWKSGINVCAWSHAYKHVTHTHEHVPDP